MMSNLRLRALEPEDVDFILECESDFESARWSDYKAPFSRRQLLDYALNYDADPFAAGQLRLIVESADQERIGILDFYNISASDRKAYVGLCIHPAFRNRGLGCESLQAAVDFSRDRLGLERLAAKVSTENPVAAKIFEKSGFTSLAILPQWHSIGNKLHDFYLLSLSLI